MNPGEDAHPATNFSGIAINMSYLVFLVFSLFSNIFFIYYLFAQGRKVKRSSGMESSCPPVWNGHGMENILGSNLMYWLAYVQVARWPN